MRSVTPVVQDAAHADVGAGLAVDETDHDRDLAGRGDRALKELQYWYPTAIQEKNVKLTGLSTSTVKL